MTNTKRVQSAQSRRKVFPLTVTGTVFGLSQGWLQLISDPLGLFPLMFKTLFTETQHSVNINPPDLNCHSVTLFLFIFLFPELAKLFKTLFWSKSAIILKTLDVRFVHVVFMSWG